MPLRSFPKERLFWYKIFNNVEAIYDRSPIHYAYFDTFGAKISRLFSSQSVEYLKFLQKMNFSVEPHF